MYRMYSKFCIYSCYNISYICYHTRTLLNDGLKPPVHFPRFSLLLSAEEIQMEVDIRQYNMDDVTLGKSKDNKRLLTLKVKTHGNTVSSHHPL